MALEKSYDLGNGILLEQAYFRVEEIVVYTPKVFDEDSSFMTVRVAVYKDAAAREDSDSGIVELKSFNVPIIDDKTGNVFAYVYVELKKLDFFVGAVDV